MLEKVETLVLHSIYLYLDNNDLLKISESSKFLYNSLNFNSFWCKACQKKNWLRFGIEVKSNFGRIDEFISDDILYNHTNKTRGDLEIPCYWRRIFIKSSYLEYHWKNGKYSIKQVPLIESKGDVIVSMSLMSYYLVLATSTKRLVFYNNISMDFAYSVNVIDFIKSLTTEDSHVYVGIANGDILCYELNNDRVKYELQGSSEKVINQIVVLSDRICGIASDDSIQVWSISAQCHLFNLTGHLDEIICYKCQVEISNQLLVTGSWDCRCLVWDVENGYLAMELLGHSEGVSCLCLLEKFVVTGSLDGSVRVWNWFEARGNIKLMLFADKEIYCVEANELIILAGGSSSKIYLWNWDGDLLQSLTGHLGIIRYLSLFAPILHRGMAKCDKLPVVRLVSAGDMRRIILWNITEDTCLAQHTLYRNPLQVDKYLINDYFIVIASKSVSNYFVVLSFI